MSAPNISDLAKSFAKQVNDALIAYRTIANKQTPKPATTPAELKVKVSNQAVTRVREPKDQAEQIVKGVS